VDAPLTTALASAKVGDDERLEPSERRRRSTSLAAIGWLNRAAGIRFFADAKKS
jgi:hypothetical protein